MNIIEKMREILESFPKINEFCNDIHIDFASDEPTSYGLSSVGDSLLKEDILGNQQRQHTFMLYSTFSAVNDFERLQNSSVLLELGLWLEKQVGAVVETLIDDEKHTGTLESIVAQNGMLYAVPQENTHDGVQYQLQIVVKYTVEN